MLPMLRFLRRRGHFRGRHHTGLLWLERGQRHTSCPRSISRHRFALLNTLSQHDLAAKQPQDGEYPLDARGCGVGLDLGIALLGHPEQAGNLGLRQTGTLAETDEERAYLLQSSDRIVHAWPLIYFYSI